MKLLVVEDEKMLAQSLKTMLEEKGYIVDVAYDGISGIEYAKLGIYDLLLLDVLLPQQNGYEVAQKLRELKCSTPILMLTACSDLESRVTGLNAGADYYLTKPFDSKELFACIHALLRRQGTQVNELSYGNTSLDLDSQTLFCEEKQLQLSAREFDIMRLLLQKPERNYPKELILEHVWGFDSNAVENHVEAYVGFLRKKLTAIGSNVQIIAIRRLGYHLEAADSC